MNRETRIEVIEYLRKLGNGEIEPGSIKKGICFNLYKCYLVVISVYVDWTTWSEFSGDKTYPVGHDPRDAYESFVEGLHLWEGEYGASRKRLCLWIADQLEKNL